MSKKLFLAFFAVVLLAASQSTTVFACSGFPYFSIDDLPRMELVVKATVIDADDRGDSAVLRVEDYYKGEGEQFLTVMRYPVALGTGALIRGYDTGCLYAGYPGDHWIKGDQGYFGLTSNGDGTFNDYDGGSAHFYPVNGIITYQAGAREGYTAEFDEPLTITEADFVSKLLEFGGRDQPVEPTTDAPFFRYPLMRFLNFTTEKGTHYQVNPDRSLSKLPADGPLAISPDGSHVAFRADDETIAFQYIWTEYSETDTGLSTANSVLKKPGQAVRFSPDSNFAVVWDDEQLTVYMFFSNSLSGMGYGNGMTLDQVAQVDLEKSHGSPVSSLLWSADSTTVVWQDKSGIWRWDIFSDAAPTQLMTTEDIQPDAQLLDISTYGRYVRVGQSGGWTLMDATTNRTYANAVAAPTEQFLIFTQTDDIPEQFGNLHDTGWCEAPLRDNCGVSISDSRFVTQSVFPYQMNLIGAVYCIIENKRCLFTNRSWNPSVANSDSYGGIFMNAGISDVRQIAYDMQYRQPALLVGEYRIDFDFYDDSYTEDPKYLPYLDLLDLKGKIDSPIVSIEWGQYVFFDTYRLTTPEYNPR